MNRLVASASIRVNTTHMHALVTQLRDKENIVISLGDIITKHTCEILPRYPDFDKQTPDGAVSLILDLGNSSFRVPLHAKEKSLEEISKEIKLFAMEHLRGNDVEKDTSTDACLITNLSSLGGYQVTAPLYDDVSSVLAIASEIEGHIIITLTYDGRRANCRQALLFLGELQKVLEAPLNAVKQ